MKLKLTPISSRFFRYQPESKCLVAEKSDLTGYNLFNQIYDDACDCGFKMVSEKTGVEVIWYLSHTEYDSEGDLRWWDFMPVIDKNTPNSVKELSVTVFND